MTDRADLEGDRSQKSVKGALPITSDNDNGVTAVIGIPHFALIIHQVSANEQKQLSISSVGISPLFACQKASLSLSDTD